jgi:AraC-like DNA-binding protein
VQPRQTRISVRLLWPFLRAIGSSPSATTRTLLRRAGLDAPALVRPDTRVPHAVAIEALRQWVAQTGDEGIGRRAAAQVESIDFGLLDQVVRSCATVREGLECTARYMHMLHEGAEVSVVDRGAVVLWRFRVTDGVPQPRVVNDFVVLGAARFGVRCMATIRPPREVHFMHPEPERLAIYSMFDPSTLRFNMPHNGFVLDRSTVEQPLPGANAQMRELLETYALEASAQVSPTVRNRVREEVVARLGSRDLQMAGVAARLGMSPPTLRRRLEEEGTTFSTLIDETRRDLAEQYLRDPKRTVDEVAGLLGFGHVPTFHRAFRRWVGLTPSQYRKRV